MKKYMYWVIGVVAFVAIGIAVYFIFIKKKGLDEDVNLGITEPEEKGLASAQGIDPNTPGWRKLWRAKKREMKAAGMSKAQIKAAKSAVKTQKVRTGNGWKIVATVVETGAQVAESYSSKNSSV
jgi:hypothetical protein